jgi:hypothetical protein
VDRGRHGTRRGAGGQTEEFSQNPPTKKSGKRQAWGLGKGLGIEGRILSNPIQQRKWTEAGMGTWGGAGGQREEFSLIRANKEKWTEAGMGTWGWAGDRGRILSNSIQQRKWTEAGI